LSIINLVLTKLFQLLICLYHLPRLPRLPWLHQVVVSVTNVKIAVHHDHRHLSNIDWWMTRTAGLVCLISTVNGHIKKRNLPWKTSASSGHIANLKQSIFVFRYVWSCRTQNINITLGSNALSDFKESFSFWIKTIFFKLCIFHIMAFHCGLFINRTQTH
jgi:hypothetical protein